MNSVFLPSENEILCELLCAHGLEARLSGECLQIVGSDLMWSAQAFIHETQDVAQLQLDVRLHWPDNRTLIESFAGWSQTLPEALQNAFRSFAASSLHVLLAAFFEESDEQNAESWSLPSRSFLVFMGDATFRGQPPVEGEALVAWFEPLETLITNAPLDPTQSHWIRFYFAQHDYQTLACELLLDNETWLSGEQEMAAFEWPVSKNFWSVRLFLVLQPTLQ